MGKGNKGKKADTIRKTDNESLTNTLYIKKSIPVR